MTFIPLSEIFKPKVPEPKFDSEITKSNIVRLGTKEIVIPEIQNQNNNDLIKFITGSAGTGKTFSVRNRAEIEKGYMCLGATTGIAAINLGTKTIHSIIKYFDTRSLEEHYMSGYLQHKLRLIREDYKNLGIDECSMLPAKQLDLFFDAIMEINQDKNPKKLGFYIVGDLLQLPPVKKPPENAEMIIKANCWPYFQENTIKLTKIWRQDNPKFVEAINLVRSGNGKAAVPLLKECGVQFVNKLIEPFDGTTIIPVNAGVDDFNTKRLSEIDSPMIRIQPKRAGTQLSEWNSQIPNELRLKVGAYVMILANDCPEFTYVNGDCGHIVSYNSTKDNFDVKLVRTGNVVTIGRIIRKNLIDEPQPARHLFTSNFTPTVDQMTGKWSIGNVFYHPLRLAYASTVHKTQGLSLDKIQADLTHYFFGSPAMCYVAISRAKTPEGLFIVGSEENLIRKINTNKEILEYI